MGRVKNIEFKATVKNIDALEAKLLTLNPEFKGLDHQVDTYFTVAKGRLKLREGNIENSLIHYERANQSAAKLSDILLYEHLPSPTLKEILKKHLGVKVVVDKLRKIYFIENVKFHFDEVKELGQFIEVEAIGKEEEVDTEILESQCKKYFTFFGLHEEDLVDRSYSDLILEKKQTLA